MEACAEEEAQLVFVGGRSVARRGGGGFLPRVTGGRGGRSCRSFQGEGLAEAEAGRWRYWRLRGERGRIYIYIYIYIYMYGIYIKNTYVHITLLCT